MEKVKLDFMIVPELLKERAYVPNAVRCKIIDPEAIFLLGILGESGRKLIQAGVELYLTKTLADNLISKGIAEEVKQIFVKTDRENVIELLKEWDELIKNYKKAYSKVQIDSLLDLANEVQSCGYQLKKIFNISEKEIYD